ncbi:MAG: hypothetical protein ACSHX7_01565 [Luteolibacter sp.]
MDALPEISLGTAALIIFGICAGYIFVRGLLRTFLSTAFLLISAWVGFRVWQHSPAIAFDLTGKNSNLITTGLPVIAAILTFFILRKITKLIRTPVPDNDEESAPRRPGRFLFRLVAAIIPAILISLTIATFIRHGSAVAEIRNSIETSETPSLATRLNNSISAAIPEWLMEKLDPVATAPRLQLAKWIVSNGNLEPVINPETGKPYPRAIIVDDPELKTLATEGQFSTLLRHPMITEALKDPSVRKSLGLE